MARRRRPERREILPDPRFGDTVLSKFMNSVMLDGKKSVAESIVYGALEQARDKTGTDPVVTLKRALDNVKPALEVRSRRVGGATYQVPVEVAPERQIALAFRWILDYAKGRKGVSMPKALALEVLDAQKNQGNAIKKRDDTHKMAQANKAFAHYRW